MLKHQSLYPRPEGRGFTDCTDKSPTKKNNVEMIETMIGLTHEIIYLKEQFKEQSFIFNDTSEVIDVIKLKYQKLLDIQPHYNILQGLKSLKNIKEKP